MRNAANSPSICDVKCLCERSRFVPFLDLCLDLKRRPELYAAWQVASSSIWAARAAIR